MKPVTKKDLIKTNTKLVELVELLLELNTDKYDNFYMSALYALHNPAIRVDDIESIIRCVAETK